MKSQTGARNYQKIGETIHGRMDKVNSELLAMTYGSLVTQLLKDFEDVQEVNAQLEKMGRSMGSRMIEEFYAKSSLGECIDFKETVEVLAKVGFKMFLGVVADVVDWKADANECTLLLPDNPLNDFVEVPPTLAKSLHYSNLICGVIKGALEQLYLIVECYFVKDTLKGDATNEIRLILKEVRREEFVDDEEEVHREERGRG